MPTYKTGTRQWAEQEVERLKSLPFSKENRVKIANLWDAITDGIYPDDPSPVYTREELEAMGQGGLF